MFFLLAYFTLYNRLQFHPPLNCYLNIISFSKFYAELLAAVAAAAKSLVMSDSVRPHRRQPTRLPSLGFSKQEH